MEEMRKIPARSEIPEDLYVSDEAWEAELATLEQDGDAMAAYAGTLGSSGEKLCEYLEKMEAANAKGELLANYCMRQSDADTRVAKYQAMVGKFMSVVVALGAKCSFETPEIMDISDEKLEGFYAACPGI